MNCRLTGWHLIRQITRALLVVTLDATTMETVVTNHITSAGVKPHVVNSLWRPTFYINDPLDHLFCICALCIFVRICFVYLSHILIDTNHGIHFIIQYFALNCPLTLQWRSIASNCTRIALDQPLSTEQNFCQNCIWTFQTMSVPIITVVMTLGQRILTDDRDQPIQ